MSKLLVLPHYRMIYYAQLIKCYIILCATFLLTVPEGVLEPVLSAVSSSEVQIDWNTPQFPNGIIVSYTLYRITAGGGEMLVASFSEVGSYIVGDLEPFTEYVFLVEACTSVGCNRSDVNSVVTLESGEPLACMQYIHVPNIMLADVHQVRMYIVYYVKFQVQTFSFQCYTTYIVHCIDSISINLCFH